MDKQEPCYLVLPYPPTVNTYWRKWRNRMVISEKGRAYRDLVAAAFREQSGGLIDGPVAVEGDVWAPDRRRRDLDNLWKSLLDALKGLAFTDDSLIHHLGPLKWVKSEGKLSVVKDGRVDLVVRALV